MKTSSDETPNRVSAVRAGQKSCTMFRTALTQLNGEQLSKVSKAPSLTVPHQVYTVREIIQRSQRGLPINSRPLPFESDEIEPDIDHPENPFVDKFEAIDSVREYFGAQRARGKKSKKGDPDGQERNEVKATGHEGSPENPLASE